MTESPTPVSGDAMELVERQTALIDEVIAYLREEADFNRSWTDGRRGPPDGADVGYRDRRLELAKQRDDWVIAIERLRSQGGAPEGWRLVPDASNMTDDQAEAIAHMAGCCGGIAYDIYRVALAAAPQPPVSRSVSRTEQVLETDHPTPADTEQDTGGERG